MLGKIGKGQASHQPVENISQQLLAPGIIALLPHPPDDVEALQPFFGEGTKEFRRILQVRRDRDACVAACIVKASFNCGIAAKVSTQFQNAYGGVCFHEGQNSLSCRICAAIVDEK